MQAKRKSIMDLLRNVDSGPALFSVSDEILCSVSIMLRFKIHKIKQIITQLSTTAGLYGSQKIKM